MTWKSYNVSSGQGRLSLGHITVSDLGQKIKLFSTRRSKKMRRFAQGLIIHQRVNLAGQKNLIGPDACHCFMLDPKSCTIEPCKSERSKSLVSTVTDIASNKFPVEYSLDMLHMEARKIYLEHWICNMEIATSMNLVWQSGQSNLDSAMRSFTCLSVSSAAALWAWLELRHASKILHSCPTSIPELLVA